MHEGQAYLVERFDTVEGIAYLRAIEADYYTEPRGKTTVQLLDKLAEAEARGARKVYGEVAVTSIVTGFRKVRWYTHENLGEGEVSLPPTELHTTGYWLEIAAETVEALRAQGLWTNAPNDYGPNWPAQRDRARERDGYRCQVCGTREANAMRPAGTGRATFDVHHKVPFRTFATVAQANQLDNLITLCPSCPPPRRNRRTAAERAGRPGLRPRAPGAPVS